VNGDSLTLQPEAECNSPQVVFEELIDLLRYSIENHPRTLQERIGPSEIGDPCPRSLIAAMFNLPERPEPPNLRAWVGTQMHAGLEQIVRAANDPDEPRYLLEHNVTVGTIGGVKITGSIDCFDVLSGTVVDYKSKSKTRLLDHRRHGPGPTYRVQAHLYGLGMTLAGYHVNQVMFLFLPRDGEFADIFHWAEPFDPQTGLDALTRANQLHALATLLGPRAAMNAYPLCDGEFCRHCKTRDLTGLVGLIAPAAQTAA
jgi:hypothetical protein